MIILSEVVSESFEYMYKGILFSLSKGHGKYNFPTMKPTPSLRFSRTVTFTSSSVGRDTYALLSAAIDCEVDSNLAEEEDDSEGESEKLETLQEWLLFHTEQ